MQKVAIMFLAGTLVMALSGCGENVSVSQKAACDEGLKQAFAELKQAEAQGLSGTVAITKASGLLSAAKIQQQFEKYPNCVDKVNRARSYIRSASQQ